MFVEGYRLVRPGREADIIAALATRRRTNVVAVVAGVGVGLAVLALCYAVVLPWVATPAPLLWSQPLMWVAPLGAAVILGVLVAWIVSGVGERRWEKTRTDPDLIRDGFAYMDAYATVPDSIPAQDLWDALDAPGGIMSTDVHTRIMAALRSERAADPPTER